jgi:pilus assembly protein Flp/PilA
MSTLRRLVAEEQGADATEYALLASLVAVALIVGAGALGGALNGAFNGLSTKLT